MELNSNVELMMGEHSPAHKMEVNMNFDGKKTYIIGVGLIAFAIGGFVAGKIRFVEAMKFLEITLIH